MSLKSYISEIINNNNKQAQELKEESKIDVDANHETIKELKTAKEENNKINKKLNKMKSLNTMFIVFIVIPYRKIKPIDRKVKRNKFRIILFLQSYPQQLNYN